MPHVQSPPPPPLKPASTTTRSSLLSLIPVIRPRQGNPKRGRIVVTVPSQPDLGGYVCRDLQDSGIYQTTDDVTRAVVVEIQPGQPSGPKQLTLVVSEVYFSDFSRSLRRSLPASSVEGKLLQFDRAELELVSHTGDSQRLRRVPESIPFPAPNVSHIYPFDSATHILPRWVPATTLWIRAILGQYQALRYRLSGPSLPITLSTPNI